MASVTLTGDFNMGYVCRFCDCAVPAGTLANKVVTSYMDYKHPFRPKTSKKYVMKNGRKKVEYADDPGGYGKQIVSEVYACPACFKQISFNNKRES